jgi:DNA-binding response OmpR family regulator
MPGRRPRILLVEDEVGVRDAYALLLDLEGYEVVTATDGVDGLEKFARDRFDLVITDLMMPRLDGLGLVKRLGEQQQHVPPIVMLTAVPEYAPEEGTALVLCKPVDVHELLDAVRTHIERPDRTAG